MNLKDNVHDYVSSVGSIFLQLQKQVIYCMFWKKIFISVITIRSGVQPKILTAKC